MEQEICILGIGTLSSSYRGTIMIIILIEYPAPFGARVLKRPRPRAWWLVQLRIRTEEANAICSNSANNLQAIGSVPY